MKRTKGTVLFGLSLAVIGYSAVYLLCTESRRAMLGDGKPELAWLKHEFNLGDAEFARISKLHEEYKPHCAEICRRVDTINAELGDLLAQTNTVTPKVDEKLRLAAEVRVACQKAMLEHFFEVSESMPPEQGKRYLAWVREKTFLPAHRMAGASDAGPTHGRTARP